MDFDIVDSIYVAFAPSSYCNVACPDNYFITPLMLSDPGLDQKRSYSANQNLTVSGRIDNFQSIDFFGGKSVEIKSGFSVNKEASLSAIIEGCRDK